jgi:hypothetical protein
MASDATGGLGSKRVGTEQEGSKNPMVSTGTEAIEPRSLDHLRGHFRSALLRPGEEGYDEARRIWNGDIDRYPALIARCAGADDVATAVRFARERDLLTSVRGGGTRWPVTRSATAGS